MSFSRQQLKEIMKHLTMISQLGLSIIMPILLCVLLCSWLTFRFDIGGWIYIPGLILGIGSSFTTAYKFYLSVMNKEKKNKKAPVSFNRHS